MDRTLCVEPIRCLRISHTKYIHTLAEEPRAGLPTRCFRVSQDSPSVSSLSFSLSCTLFILARSENHRVYIESSSPSTLEGVRNNILARSPINRTPTSCIVTPLIHYHNCSFVGFKPVENDLLSA